MLQCVHLLMDGAIYPFIAVPYTDRKNAGEKIEVLISVRIKDELVFGMRNYERLAPDSRSEATSAIRCCS
jgi:hypothetical protein